MVRSWLVFFGPADPPYRWLTRRGFGHVFAVGYDPLLELWLVFDPCRHGTLVSVCRESPAFQQWLGAVGQMCAPHVLRVEAQSSRRFAPPLFSCTAAVKALLGSRSRALTPYGLYRDLKRAGAEVVDVPCVAAISPADPSSPHGNIRQPGPATGRPGGCARTQGAGRAGEAGPYRGDAAAACAGDASS